MDKETKSYFEEDIITRLQDSKFQTDWIEISLQDFLKDGNTNTLTRCLTYVLKAHGTKEIPQIAKSTDMNTNNLYEIMTGKETPTLDTALKLINSLGYKFDVKLTTN